VSACLCGYARLPGAPHLFSCPEFRGPRCLLPDDDTAVKRLTRALGDFDAINGFGRTTQGQVVQDIIAALRGVASEGRDSTEGGQR
jgi:hypothetical protein